jgi:hypothetical protein
MAGPSLWSKLARLWASRPRCREVLGQMNPKSRPFLEPLGDRNLMSAVPTLIHPIQPIVLLQSSNTPVVLSADGTVIPIVVGSQDYDSSASLTNGKSDPATDHDAKTSDQGVGDAMIESSFTSPIHAPQFDAAGGIWNSAAVNLPVEADLAARLQQILGMQWEYNTNSRGMDGPGEREWAGELRLLSDTSVLTYLLRPGLDARSERRESDTGTTQSGVLDQPPERPDGSGIETVLIERNENLGLNRSMATIFRQDPSNEEETVESPASLQPEYLVAYDGKLPAPQTQLLPLEDGGRALVAALVAGAAEQNSYSAPTDSPAAYEPLTGSAVGLESGRTLGADHEVEVTATQPPTKVESPQNSLFEASDFEERFHEVDRIEWPALGEAARPAIHLIDALFAVGMFHLYCRESNYTDGNARREKPS